MADSTIIPAELDISDLSSEETLENLQKAGLEVFEVAGAIKWFDASKGYGFIVPDNGLATFCFTSRACVLADTKPRMRVRGSTVR